MEVKTLPGKTEVGKPLTDSLECQIRDCSDSEDETKLLEAEDAQATSLELTQAVLPGALGGLDCRFERYGRIFLLCSEANDGEVTRAVLTCFHELNAALLGLRPQELPPDGEFLLRELSCEEQADPHLDLLSGFCVLDGRSRLFVIEGLREGHSFSKLLEMIPRGPDAPKLLHNTAIGFGERLYISFGPRLKQVKLRGTLERLSFRPALYSWNKSAPQPGFMVVAASHIRMWDNVGQCDKIALGDCLLRLEIARPTLLVQD
eukprot:s8266_g3.t1